MRLSSPFQDANAPFTVNTMYIIDDMKSYYGGTLVVPGSHRLISVAGSGNPITEPLPPAINLAAPAGTVMIHISPITWSKSATHHQPGRDCTCSTAIPGR